MPDPAELAATLEALVATMAAESAGVATAAATFRAAAQSSEAMPKVPAMNATLNGLAAVIHSFRPAPIKEALADIDGVVGAMPDLEEFSARVEGEY